MAVLLDVCGQGLALHRERGYTILLWLPRFLLAGVAARLALKAGGAFMLRSFRIFNLFYFSSDIYRIKLDGTFTASRIGFVPGSKHGGLESNRVSVQSDCYVHLHGCHVLSESAGLAGVMGMRGERIIVSAPESPELQARLEALSAGIAAFKDSSSQLPPVKLDGNMADLININTQISAAQAGAERAGQITAQRAAPRPCPLSRCPGPARECPRPSRMIRSVAPLAAPRAPWGRSSAPNAARS